jgi:undecaprenyl-diphosphatase
MKRKIFSSAIFLAAFSMWTAAVLSFDVQPAGPMDSMVGFATLNLALHRSTGVQWWLYQLTDVLGLIPIGIMAAFAILGLCQWIRRKHFLRVDAGILTMGALYGVVLAFYALFEYFVVNYRPVLIDGVLEASYPSSTTLLVLTIMPTAAMYLRRGLKAKWLRAAAIWALYLLSGAMVVGRLLSGVHWFSDILGGVLLSVALVDGYAAVCSKYNG